ncbi:hypothetical protein G7Z17_g8087 [Cylindrodendrum hubeiense]|uniref:Uncharacterized protein n=1 Tax=Cylindrodendrum hubeiense TaxID=595255 RepID=A0A9P5HA99_9HYPO|nr:hypothetical protein G7Z17_g8087 [Cylindrodendrum hubeiense]
MQMRALVSGAKRWASHVLWRFPTVIKGHARQLSEVKHPIRSEILLYQAELERLERTVRALVDRLDSRLEDIDSPLSFMRPPPASNEPESSTDLNPAPVFLIRDAATDAGVYSPDQNSTHSVSQSDVISAGLVTIQTAHTLLALYCVGTRRQALLNQVQIDRCHQFANFYGINNYEERMVAEVELYWIIYNKCGGPKVDLADTKLKLQHWQREWVALFNEPRSQFLQMGFHFAHLLAYCQSLKLPKSVMHNSILEEMIRLSKSIINLAIDTADERTRHLTDHIYHIVTFSAITLCRIVCTYEPKLRAANYDITSLDNLVLKLVKWLKTIGLPCHAAHMLGDIVSVQFRKLRPNFQPAAATATYSLTGDDGAVFAADDPSLPPDIPFLYPNFIGSEIFSMEADMASWPQWDQIRSDTDTPI